VSSSTASTAGRTPMYLAWTWDGTGGGLVGAVRPGATGHFSMTPVRTREDHWWVESLAHARPMGSTGSRENAADIGVSPWTDHAGQQAAPAWSADRLQDAMTGHGSTCFQLAGARKFPPASY
jgi:hypothetical protein